MLSKRFIAVAGLAVLVGAGAPGTVPGAHAQWYASGNAGVSILRDYDFTDTFTAGSITGEVESDNGAGFSAAVGHDWGGLRVEGEFSYRENDLDSVRIDTLTVAGVVFTGLGTFDFEGDTTSYGFMVNGWYDFDTGSDWVPFVGLGLGVAKVKLDITSVAGVAVTYDESDTVLAYQVGAGLGYRVTPMMTVNLSYRYFATKDPEFDDGVDKIETEYASHNIMVGLIARF